ncbi:AraC family transcriptional regulator [Chryseobacterium indologenes]|uniref:AraC family transcriptional regulator n=1 Tax=Chryseobacterium indologenes TaxID=253 RepID=UPI000BFDE758|nr:AraC family transcriptional regulator [Chryseobacterium indologenes]ATN04757.1 AraC family transcriptional regulator [Chryseobacterium indologenes]AYY86492.1 AraC family transcriptional regulator [Chryseobacterium indologenes]QIX83385.1 AraC family transcriptional regulator [Chryseobacterium indologenes]UDQ53079.1 AraC family transcriptional regulator [Chryseobacterium indologenes]
MEDNLNCIYKVIHFIEKNYDQQISVKDLEDVSHYSYRNIQRIFKYSCGETIGAFQQRLKLENAYKRILYTTENLTSIGIEVGFANIASFSKAFKQHFGMSPKEAKLSKERLLCGPELVPITSGVLLEPEIIYLKPVQVFYQSVHTHYNNAEIELLWENFMENKFEASDAVYFGIIADEPLIKTEISCRYDACVSVQANNKKLPSKTILGGKYARFIHTGSYDTIDETYTKIYSRWIFNSGLEFSHSPIIEKYERHAAIAGNEEEQLTYILLPLK